MSMWNIIEYRNRRRHTCVYRWITFQLFHIDESIEAISSIAYSFFYSRFSILRLNHMSIIFPTTCDFFFVQLFVEWQKKKTFHIIQWIRLIKSKWIFHNVVYEIFNKKNVDKCVSCGIWTEFRWYWMEQRKREKNACQRINLAFL